MSHGPFTLLKFDNDSLAAALSNKLTAADIIKSRTPFKYFCDYLGDKDDGLDAKTILIEHKYVSKSYLIDYSNYYSTCFEPYERFCKRLHFFSSKFTKKEFEEAIRDDGKGSKIWNSYLGYIVVKPLPVLTVGATLLKTYASSTSNKRIFTASKPYPINLFGKQLTIQSLAFQEQDSVVGACASSALWSAFHKTSHIFQTELPSPSDITKSAKNLFFNSGRTYPNTGLDFYQIGNAIESVGLVSELRNKKFPGLSSLKSFVYAYAKMGLPILLGINFPGLGGHLITITGYREENPLPFPRVPGEISLKASKIERFYAHDDQVGPFSRLSFISEDKVETSWPDSLGTGKIVADFVSLSVPINHKIRLTYENIFTKINLVDFYFCHSVRFKTQDIYWDIFLYLSNQYKMDLRSMDDIDEKIKIVLLTEAMPKYVWIAKGFVNRECVIEFLFDATQIANADSCIFINVFNLSFKKVMNLELGDQSVKEYFVKNLGQHFYDLLLTACHD